MRDETVGSQVRPPSTEWPFPFNAGTVALEVCYGLPEQRIWTARTTSERGLPSIDDAPIWDAIITLWRQFGHRPAANRTLNTTLEDLVQALGTNSVQTHERIIQSLFQLKQVQVKQEQQIGRELHTCHFNLINRVETSTAVDVAAPVTIELELSAAVVESITEASANLFDAGRYAV